MNTEGVPKSVTDALFVKASENLSDKSERVRGFEFNDALEGGSVDYDKLFDAYVNMGFQATNLGLAIKTIKEMLRWRLSDDPVSEDESDEFVDMDVRRKTRATVFLGYTSNMISCGIRENIRFLCEHKLVDVLVSTAGGIEEDFIKCLAPTYMGDFALPGKALREKGLNRIGNLIIPNDNYCLFEDWVSPILLKMKEEQQQGTVWSPSKIIARLGKEINNPNSVYYWCWKNDIPVFCPAITDGSLGDMLYFNSYEKGTPLVVDIAQDVRRLNDYVCFLCFLVLSLPCYDDLDSTLNLHVEIKSSFLILTNNFHPLFSFFSHQTLIFLPTGHLCQEIWHGDPWWWSH